MDAHKKSGNGMENQLTPGNRPRVVRRQPLVDLPELLLEIQARTGFASEFSHISEARSRLDDFLTSICAVLLAETYNIGLTPMIRKGIPAPYRHGKLPHP